MNSEEERQEAQLMDALSIVESTQSLRQKEARQQQELLLLSSQQQERYRKKQQLERELSDLIQSNQEDHPHYYLDESGLNTTVGHPKRSH